MSPGFRRVRPLFGWLALALGACSSRAEPTVHGRRPPIPALVAPAAGSFTGSLRIREFDPLRPQVAWAPVVLGIRPITYDVEIDDSCHPGALAACRFPSPEARASHLSGLAFRPEKPLPVNRQRPLGRRYYWRVRACAGSLCSDWSAVRYLEVGRTRGDLNGDGYSDVVVGAPLIDNGGVDRGSVFVYYGNRGGVGMVNRIDDPAQHDGSNFGVAVAIAGDVDGDGYADLVVGAAGAEEARGATYLFLGSSLGVWPTRALRLDPPGGAVDDWFGAAVAGAGDVDGDGFSDLVVGASGTNRQGQDWGVAYVYRGGAAGMTAPPVVLGTPSLRNFDHFGFAVAGAGDLDGDGFDDVVVGSPGIDVAGRRIGTDRGAVYLFHGRATGIATSGATRLEAPVPLDYDRFGYSVAGAGDLDGDGYADLVVGAPGRDSVMVDGGTAYIYRGGSDGVDATPAALLQDPTGEYFDRFGTSVAGIGDVDGDGVDDLAIGTSGAKRGRALIYHGTRELGLRLALALRDPLGDGYNEFAENVAGAGDINGDGYDDLIIGASGADNGGVFRGSVVLYPGTADGIASRHPLRRDDPDFGEHDHFGHTVAGR